MNKLTKIEKQIKNVTSREKNTKLRKQGIRKRE
jgi:hypothetical protein